MEPLTQLAKTWKQMQTNYTKFTKFVVASYNIL